MMASSLRFILAAALIASAAIFLQARGVMKFFHLVFLCSLSPRS